MNFRALCPHCDTASRYSGEWQGRQLICGNAECGRSFTPRFVVEDKPRKPAPRPAKPPAAPAWAEPVAPSGDEFTLVEPADTPFAEPVAPGQLSSREPPFAAPLAPLAQPVVPLARPVAAPFASPVTVPLMSPASACPCCGKPIAEDAVVCPHCDTNVITGRRRVEASSWDKAEDREYLEASWLRIPSLLTPFVPLPYYSEVPLRRRPMALLLIAFLAFVCYPLRFSEWANDHFALWGGDPSRPQTHTVSADEASPGMAAGTVIVAPAQPFHWFQLITSIFMHGDTLHIAFNLAFLLVVGPKVNDVLGNMGFTVAYLILGAAAGMSHLFEMRGELATPAVGASGALMAVAGMYAVFCPQHRIRIAIGFRYFVLTPCLIIVLLRFAEQHGVFPETEGLYAIAGLLLLGIAVATLIAYVMHWCGNPALRPFVRLYCWPFRVRGLWVVLFFVALDLYSIFAGSQDQVGHGVHFIGFLSGAILAALLVATKRVRCAGYDLLTWCFGQEEFQKYANETETSSDQWANIASHPVFLGAVLITLVLSAVAHILFGV